MKLLQIERSPALRGSVAVPGSKNSSLALLAAACLADEPVRLSNIPTLGDYEVIERICREMGIVMRREGEGDVYVDARDVRHADIDPALSARFRTAYYFVGALLAKLGKVTVGLPGGDDFGSRPIDQHVKALQAFGATVDFRSDRYTVDAGELGGADIYFDVITSGATINAMLAAVRAKGRTYLRNAARDPEVVDTALLLMGMGARISGAGTDTIRIDGVGELLGCSFAAMPDRLIAGTFLIAAGMNGGEITVRDAVPEHMRAVLMKLNEIGIETECHDNGITAFSDGGLKAVRVRTAMYPGFPTDLQQPLTALLLQAKGSSIIADRIYPKRFNHVHQLDRMGARIDLRGNAAFIRGGAPLTGSYVHATDVRAGMSLVLAGLAADGVTTITGVHHIERGYENAAATFRSLGGKVTLSDATESDGKRLLAFGN